MALQKAQKQSIVEEISQALLNSKLTTIAEYTGTPVKEMQALRQLASDNNTTVKVIKNRLFRLALSKSEVFKDFDTTTLNGMLVYAFNPDDELASAQTLAKFARTQPTIKIVAAVSSQGEYFNTADAKDLADLPTKQQLQGQLVGLINTPLSSLASVISANISGFVRALNARAKQVS